ncbi:UDP-N-acetyl-D-mannosamine dehydrogenase [Wohlfahrtiimonas chitiniclastica]|uniref:UDP-N-acetyl-D-mannosamine dehydrogenase n=1 Tax=Wohlfahrtiimonas chitiniclastica TaxID=400946 RepID=A0AB35BXC5_9GAMM|nr:UDP-N-acetyl-D-mannosamine dehydrogenase [Wohlfahrtiimonas chitiniclastica]MBS7824935.1 UDP-N-acetyl-D-mannosamine dehydrogenase [Wohlfahrtiimonas chitiniclastica]MBS7840544.1 UDP-N-acetyl-D-mannosamine dehydrogenase [Wohlfahrtiimonas chitiniclastica]
MAFQTVSVIGLGYIGLPAAAMFASKKVKVIGVDVNEKAVNIINQGKIHIVEPGLEDLVRVAVADGFLRATTKPEKADAFVIAVPTPFKGDYEPDVSYIEAVAKAIAPVLEKGNTIILESTSPVGTTEQMIEWLETARPDLNFPKEGQEGHDVYVAYCPERVLPGQVIRELVENDRIIGGITPDCSEKAVEVYRIFVKGELPTTNARTAEMAKLTENAFRDVNIAFANELSLISDKLDINVWELIELSNRHPRVNILQPGPGVGGHCIAVDPWFIVSKSPAEAKLIRAAREVNDGKPQWVINKVQEAVASAAEKIGKTVNDVKIVCYGLAFKPNIDDLRESPALMITNKLAALYPNQVLAVEPNIANDHFETKQNFELVSCDAAKEIADVAVILVDHNEFKAGLSFNNDAVIVDTKGIV